MCTSPAMAGLQDAPQRTGDHARWHALIVDDDSAMRQGLAGLLSQGLDGLVHIHLACSLASAREALRAHPPDVVLLDLDLAGEDGLQLMPELGNAHVVVVTSQADAITRRRVHQAGAAGLHAKASPASALLGWLRARLVTPQARGDQAPGAAGASSVSWPLRDA